MASIFRIVERDRTNSAVIEIGYRGEGEGGGGGGVALVTREKMGGHKLKGGGGEGNSSFQTLRLPTCPPLTPPSVLFAHRLIYAHSGRCAHHLVHPFPAADTNVRTHLIMRIHELARYPLLLLALRAYKPRADVSTAKCGCATTHYAHEWNMFERSEGVLAKFRVCIHKHTRPSESAALSLNLSLYLGPVLLISHRNSPAYLLL